MSSESDFRVRDFGSSRLKLRQDLTFAPQKIGGQPGFLVEDPVNSKFFRIGAAEYAFISQLDGHRSVAEALAATASSRPEDALTEQEAASICKWLIESQLAHTDESSQPQRLIEQALENRKQQSGFNPLFVRMPLFRPDRFFAAITPAMAWLFSWWMFWIWLALAAAALFQVSHQWSRFVVASQGVLAPGNWLWLGLCWLGLKFVHEIGHGVVCKKYGGQVREAGAILILLSPMAYVDVTSSWRFRSKWQRIFTATAGMYIELLIASLAALLWCRTAPGVLANVYFNLIVMASAMTLIFNANPLMRFDGYYILSDLLELPNLYGKGQRFIHYWGRRYLMGIQAQPPVFDSPIKGLTVRCYAVMTWIWRLLVCACLIVAASTLFRGAGLIIAAVAVVGWIVRPAMKLTQYLIHGKPGEQPRRLRFALLTGSAVAAVALLLVVAPWPGLHRAAAVVQYAPLSVIRADSDGFIRQIHVHGGQHVKAGQVLVVLENEELQLKGTQLALEIEKSKIAARQHQQKNELAEYQAELSRLEALNEQRDEIQQQIDNLTLVAPRDGEVIGRHLDSLLGTYVEQGSEILSIGQEEHKELRISVSQDDLDVFALRAGENVNIRLPGRRTFASKLSELRPQASLRLPHASLAAPLGGSLPVRAKSTESSPDQEQQYELVSPRFTGIVTLDASQAAQFGAGQRGSVCFRSNHRSIGEHLYMLVSQWVREKVQTRSE